MAEYEIVFLSHLLKKSRRQPHPDYLAAVDFIWSRLDTIREQAASSEFNSFIRWLKRLVPRSFLPILLYRLRYDALIGFRTEQGQREIYGMISFQKHPQNNQIGMFDIYIKPERRNKDLMGNFATMADLVYELTLSFRDSGYEYIQCGKNRTTQKLLKLYRRVNNKKNRDVNVDIEKSRIYLS